jgi:hypothetical protein
MGADADPTDADVAALEAELERFKADATRQLDEIAALTDAADACIADAKRETHEARAPAPVATRARCLQPTRHPLPAAAARAERVRPARSGRWACGARAAGRTRTRHAPRSTRPFLSH